VTWFGDKIDFLRQPERKKRLAHHLDSPIARQDIRLDITDLYVFRGETGTAFVINVCHSIAGPVPAPGYHPEGMYEFKIDLDGDAVEDVTYRITFDERDDVGRQRFVLRCIRGPEAVDPHAAGTVLAQGKTEETTTTAGGVRIWAARAGDPFWIEPDVLHAVGHAFQDGTTIDLSGWDPSKAKNLFAGHTVYSIVLEVPDAELLAGARGRRVGVWAVATLATDAGGWRPINRIGLPMIHPLFTQYNEDLGNNLNGGRPSDDFATFGAVVSRRSPASYPPMAQPAIRRPTARSSRTGSSPTSSHTRSAPRRCSASPSGTDGR
jgi:Domain of unknown function (DUF4331)